MPGQVSIDCIEGAILEGIVKAHKDYETWTGGDWLWNAPEYLLTTYVAQSISSTDGTKYISLENNVKSGMEDAGAVGSGRLHSDLRHNGRFDILLWWAGGDPRAAIEVKKQIFGYSNLEKDVKRLKEALRRKKGDSTLQFSMIVYYTACQVRGDGSPVDKIMKRVSGVEDGIKSSMPGFRIKQRMTDVYEDGDSAWVGCVVTMKGTETK